MATTLSLSKEKKLRLLYRILFALIAFVAPLVFVCLKFEVFTKTETTKYKISAVFLIMLVIILWRFKKRLYDWVISWEYSILKYILIGFSRVYLFIIALAILYLSSIGLESVIFCLEWICLCECIAYLIIYPLEMRHDNNIKRLIRKLERKEDYKEAIKELGE